MAVYQYFQNEKKTIYKKYRLDRQFAHFDEWAQLVGYA